MCISKLSVGLDYHQDQVQVCVVDEQGKVLMNRSLSNHAQAIHGALRSVSNGKQLSRFCGVTPRNASSGNRQADAGLIRAGNPQLRRVLIELSHRLINSAEPRWSKLAGKLLNEGKKKNVVVAAIANRWVRWLHHQMLPAELAA